jgi:predicted nucleotidyltransferase
MRRLFASETLTRLLTLFLLHPERDYYQSELVTAIDGKLYLVQRELVRLESVGLIERTKRGRQVYYKALPDYPAFNDLKQAFLKTVAIGEAMRQQAAQLAGRVRLAFIYGSVARGDERAGSDIDIAVVGDISTREAITFLGDLGRELRREVNTAVYPTAEFADKAHAGHHFITELIEGPKIWLIGDEDELQRLVD